ncbi:BREX system Lon protease-like protein BrxL [Thermodesulfobacteriota bacterium]
MAKFEQKAKDLFAEITINKGLIHQAGFGSRAIPTYVGEWIIAHFVGDDEELTDENRSRIAGFIQKFVPAKGEKELIRNMLLEQNEVKFLDNFSIFVNLVKGDRYLAIPFLDESNAFVSPQIVEDNEMLLKSGLWGVGTLFYIPPSDENPKGQVWMKEFKPFQLANVDLEYFCDVRKEFATAEWIDLIVSSMGFSFRLYSERQKILLITRLLPIVEPRYNLVEPAPKGTGKSFVFDNMSRYVAVRAGRITASVLFFNDARKTPGLITKYDCVVIDEAQKVKTDTSGELTALLKTYLEAGKFGRGTAGAIAAEAGLVLLANIDIDENRKPMNEEIGIFRNFPNFLRETAFIDRFSGLLPGWYLPRITKDTPSKNLGLKGDIFGEILHSLRADVKYRDYVKTNMELPDCDDMRDAKAIEAGASGLLKILFPDLNPTEEEFYAYCANPAVELRQRIRDELCKLDREYEPKTIKSKRPDEFQNTHVLPVYYDIDEDGKKVAPVKPPTIPEPKKDKPEIDPLDPDREPIETTIEIAEGQEGFSYEKLFKPYLVGATSVKVVDPYIRYHYQIQNFIGFCEIITPPQDTLHLDLITAVGSNSERIELTDKFDELKTNLANENVIFSYSFGKKMHDRWIESDTGWRIILSRGLDFIQKPEAKFALGLADQTKRACKASKITYIRNKEG